jgi:hypothetical protein
VRNNGGRLGDDLEAGSQISVPCGVVLLLLQYRFLAGRAGEDYYLAGVRLLLLLYDYFWGQTRQAQLVVRLYYCCRRGLLRRAVLGLLFSLLRRRVREG